MELTGKQIFIKLRITNKRRFKKETVQYFKATKCKKTLHLIKKMY